MFIHGVLLSARNGIAPLLFALALTGTISGAAKNPFEQATVLEQQGKLKEARSQYHEAAEAFRASGDQRNLATTLSAAGRISISLGDYRDAIRDAEEAVRTRQGLQENDGLGRDFNTIGRAYQYLADFPAAMKNYEESLKFDRASGNAAGEIATLNNIGNIHYFQGRYMRALESYQTALPLVEANGRRSWYFWGRKLTLSNIATVYQKLGLEERALELYQQTPGKPAEMPVADYASILANEGILYRHLGDPIKALETYHTVQSLYRTARLTDGEISALRNIGIVKTMDLNDLPGALEAFSAALKLARQSSNTRGAVHASLYLGNLMRRLHRYKEATSYLQTALDSARAAGLVEEQWKARYELGRVADETGASRAAVEDYRTAVGIIESVRAGLRTASLRTDFLADKRDVYDALIAFELRRPQPSTDEIFRWMERSRARNLQDRVAGRTPLIEPRLQAIQAHLTAESVLVEMWLGNQNSAAVWITSSGSGIVGYGGGDELRRAVLQLFSAIENSGEDWKQPARELGAKLLAGIPIKPHMIVVQDGGNIPMEVLSLPGSDQLLVERCDVTYLPSARLVAMPDTGTRRWLFPWNRELVALGDPPVSSSDALAQNQQWQALPGSAMEVRAIARAIRGRAEIHLGSDARKVYLLDGRLEGVPLLHVSTHAVIDPERPDRSRILLASGSSATDDYLFQDEVAKLDLKNVGLVTVSACDTAQGKIVVGEGVQSFSQAFLAAGASSTVTSMWKVADEPAASFMTEFYYSLAHGASKAEALRAAQLEFLHSNSALSNPRYWAAFVLTGDGWHRSPRFIPWSAILIALAAILGTISLVLWLAVRTKVAKKAPRKAPQFA